MPPQTNNSDKTSVLKTTREAKGLTLEIVHEATKIPMDALRAIEEGYSVRILSPFYYRGFIKIYSEFLGLDAQEMYKQYGLNETPKASSTPSTIALKSKRNSLAQPKTMAQPNVVLEQVQEWLSSVLKPKNLMLALKVIGFFILIILLVKMTGCIASHLGKRGMHAKHQGVVMQIEKKEAVADEPFDDKPAPLQVTPPPEVKHEALQAQSENNKVEVAVRANKNTWIQVKADGHVVFQMTLSKGSMESWSAIKKIELSGRNIEQLDMEVNGKHVGSLGGGERRIRKVLITQEGLTVKK